jgi:hypothetical protein
MALDVLREEAYAERCEMREEGGQEDEELTEVTELALFPF